MVNNLLNQNQNEMKVRALSTHILFFQYLGNCESVYWENICSATAVASKVLTKDYKNIYVKI